VLSEFFRYPILDKQFIYNLGVISPGGAGRNRVLNKADFLKIELALPEVAEQKKIADCLGSLDDLIAADGRKLEVLRQHKQGLMQQLFPQPGETVPRLRFPEFQNAGEWEEKELGDVSEVLMCKRIFASETNPNGGVPFYKIGTLGGVPDAFISKELFEEYKLKYNFPRTGEILITCSGTVGRSE
jgi:type I restriction enzyme S subunit